jgi:hypothetical protein
MCLESVERQMLTAACACLLGPTLLLLFVLAGYDAASGPGYRGAHGRLRAVVRHTGVLSWCAGCSS